MDERIAEETPDEKGDELLVPQIAPSQRNDSNSSLEALPARTSARGDEACARTNIKKGQGVHNAEPYLDHQLSALPCYTVSQMTSSAVTGA